jgi:hypothetical protein
MNTSATHTRRRYLRVSLRSLVVLILVIGGYLGWIVHTARVQRDAVAAIRKLEGTVRYDWERKDGLNRPNGKPWWPKWLVDSFGVDYFGHVTQVRVVAVHELSEAELIHISHLTQLEELDLHRSPVTDARLAHLEGLTDLQSLILFHTPISDAGLVHLRKLTRLRTLSIEDTKVTDAGARELRNALPKLTISR